MDEIFTSGSLDAAQESIQRNQTRPWWIAMVPVVWRFFHDPFSISFPAQKMAHAHG